MLSEVVTCNCVRNPGEHAESNPRPSEEGVSFYITSSDHWTLIWHALWHAMVIICQKLMAFRLGSLGLRCLLRLFPAGLIVSLVPGCCWAYSDFGSAPRAYADRYTGGATSNTCCLNARIFWAREARWRLHSSGMTSLRCVLVLIMRRWCCLRNFLLIVPLLWLPRRVSYRSSSTLLLPWYAPPPPLGA